MSTDVADRLNAALSGRYHIERELGQGGMATVYLADDIKNERKVALKVLKPQLAAVVGAERFLAEIKTTANLIYFEGSSVEELEASMARAVDQYLAVCEKRGEEPGKPFSGQIRIRIESELHRKLSAAAATSGTSLNSYIAGALEAATAHRPRP